MPHSFKSSAILSFEPLFVRCAAFCKELRRAIGLLCLVGGILLNLPVYGHSSPEWSSTFRFGGSSGTNIGQAVKVDRDGNSYVTGAFSATAHFQAQHTSSGSGTGRSLTSVGGTDSFLAKYGPAGTLQWLIQMGGPGDDEGFDIAFDAARNVYVTGVFTDSATFQGFNNSGKTVTGTGQTIFLAKYTPFGVLAWVQTGTIAFSASNNGYGVAVEPGTGSVYVTGVSQGDTTFSSSSGAIHSVSGPSTWHMVLAKYDIAGNFQWGVSNAASPNTVGHKVAVDADNNAYVTGWMEGQTVFGSNDGHDLEVDGFSGPVQSYPDYPGDAYVVKYDENGNLQWVNHIGGYKAIGTDIATSRDGRVSITGLIGNIGDSPSQAATIVTSQPGANNINLGGGQITQPFNKDVFFATYDEDGVLLEAQRFGGPQDDGGSGIAYDRHGNLILAGIFQGTIAIQGSTLTGKDPYNLFIAKFSRNEVSCVAGFADHTLDWAAEADGPFSGDFENNPRIGLTKQGGVMVTGSYQPTAQFGSLSLGSTGSEDGFLAFLNALEGHR
jgi:hypothetical protein